MNKKEPATLLIIGDVRAGEDKQIFEEFRHSNPNAKIVVTGFVSQKDLPVYYSLMDVFVHPALRDGLPNALLEAISCEKAVTDCENGRFVRTNDATELANAVDELLEDESLCVKLGKAACQTIKAKFTVTAELGTNLAVYRRLEIKM